ncbi:MAG: transcriptional repressor [Bacteroides sp.]|jgi:Fur family ferric uptake transcriptional regulator/Fur family peroxide stress response transcriptional regulator|nr:transcriptional repressor [Bacteroides sp.]MCI1682171.1 transcriptional repressor [Bacteroides sp.]
MNVIEHLQEHSIKPSVQRIAIMQYLIEHRTHPTVEEIYSTLLPTIPTLSKTTVYNTLKLLSEHGAAQTLTIDERNTCYDADTSPHAHFLCKHCGKVYDLPIQNDAKQVEEMSINGHEIQEIHYYYKGICKECKNKK